MPKLEEAIRIMKLLWSGEEVSVQGRYGSLERMRTALLPAQRPHPPIYLGGHGSRALRRVVDYCDGWLPIGARAGDLAAGIVELRRLAQEKGRDPDAIAISVYGAPMDADALARLRDLGVGRVIFPLPSAGADEVLPLLDRGVELMGGLA